MTVKHTGCPIKRPKITAYHIERAATLDGLTMKVNAAFREGWQPYGPPHFGFHDGEAHAQAMVKYD